MNKETRRGKHKIGSVRIQLYTTKDTKALVGYTAWTTGKTMTDLLLNGALTSARLAGIIDKSGRISEEHLARFEGWKERVRKNGKESK